MTDEKLRRNVESFSQYFSLLKDLVCNKKSAAQQSLIALEKSTKSGIRKSFKMIRIGSVW